MDFDWNYLLGKFQPSLFVIKSKGQSNSVDLSVSERKVVQPTDILQILSLDHVKPRKRHLARDE